MTLHEAPQYGSDRSVSTGRLLTIDDVAFRLAISRDTVYRLVKSGELRPSRVGDRLRFRPDEIDAYLERNREQVASP